MGKTLTVLGIETSCDDTAVALLSGREILAESVSSQIETHALFGGVVPEIAARAHQEVILGMIEKMPRRPDLIAVTHGPGLMGSLLVGVLTARGLAMTWGVPTIGVNHIEGHIFANNIVGEIAPPFLSLVVSGGHTEIVRVREWGDYEIIGHTRDDAAGEAFDKGAKLLGIGYPGGAIIDRLAKNGDPNSFDFPIPLKNTNKVEFSFSGLKTALLWKLKNFENKTLSDETIANLCASYQFAIVESLIKKLELAVAQTGITRVALSGGVAANSELRRAVLLKKTQKNWEVSVPPVKYCTDNAVMIAMAGANAWARGVRNVPCADPSCAILSTIGGELYEK